MATSFPLKDLIDSVTSVSARIASTSWAKVRRGISSEPPKAIIGAANANSAAASHVRRDPISVRLGQRRKVFCNLRAVRKDCGQQPGQGSQDNDAGQNCGFENVDEKRVRDQAARSKQRARKVSHEVAGDDP